MAEQVNEWTDYGEVLVEFPLGLGGVTAMRIEKERLICETESGATFIFPLPPPLKP